MCDCMRKQRPRQRKKGSVDKLVSVFVLSTQEDTCRGKQEANDSNSGGKGSGMEERGVSEAFYWILLLIYMNYDCITY